MNARLNATGDTLSDGKPIALSGDGRWAIFDVAPISGVCTLAPTGPGETHTLPTGKISCLRAY